MAPATLGRAQAQIKEGDAQLGRSIDGTSSQKLPAATVGTTCPTSSLSRLTATWEGRMRN
jgi:hypothetical protein